MNKKIKILLLSLMACPLLLTSCAVDNFSKMKQEFMEKVAPYGSQVEFKTGIGDNQDEMIAIVYNHFEVHAYLVHYANGQLMASTIPFR